MENTEKIGPNSLSFDEVYRLKYKDIYRYCFYAIKYNKNDAEDVANDVFVALYEIWESFDPKNELTVTKWLYKTAHNMVLNHNKKGRNRPNTVDYDEVISEMIPDQIDALSTNNVEEWEDNENCRQYLERIKAELSNSQYEIFELSVLKGYCNAEIAKMLRMKENTVKVTLHRIRAKLKKALK